MLDLEQIKKRWSYAWEAKQDELDRMQKAYFWMYEFERHLRMGEEGDQIYRFPELMGYVIRRYNEYLQILPDTTVKGNSDYSIGLKATIDHIKNVSNIDNIKVQVFSDVAAFGNGCIMVKPQIWERKFKDRKDAVVYHGLASERVDWRMFFPAPGYRSLHDHTGLNSCPYVFRRKVYHYDSFKLLAEFEGWKNIENVQATTWNNANIWGDSDWMAPHELGEVTGSKNYVCVLEYWDIINDELRYYASGGVEIFVSKVGNPYSHKQLPFHHYKNVPRFDSINAIGEIELNMPYNLFREKIFNLSIDDLMIQIQRPLIVDGEIGFNPEEHEMQSGAVFSVKGIAGGKLQDHIMPLNLGGAFNSNTYQIIQMVENSRISVTSDDTTALYSNPNQLATQTMAKMQNLNKSIDGANIRNIHDCEFYLMNQICSYVKNELAEPYNDQGKTKYQKIKIQGYEAIQDREDKDVKFVKMYGSEGEFSLNKTMAEGFDQDEIEIIPPKKDDELKRDRTEKMMTFLNSLLSTIGQLATSQPQMIQEIFGNMNVPELIKTMAKNLGLENELSDIFPIIKKDLREIDYIDAEHEQIMMGIVPECRPDENSLKELQEHQEFMNSKWFIKNSNKKSKEALSKHIIKTLQNVQLQISIPVSDRQKGMGQPQGAGGQQGIQSVNPMVGGQAQPGGANLPLPPQGGGMEPGIPSGPAQPMPPVPA